MVQDQECKVKIWWCKIWSVGRVIQILPSEASNLILCEPCCVPNGFNLLRTLKAALSWHHFQTNVVVDRLCDISLHHIAQTVPE